MLSNVYEFLVKMFVRGTERGLIPDFILRAAIRYLLGLRSSEVGAWINFSLPDDPNNVFTNNNQMQPPITGQANARGAGVIQAKICGGAQCAACCHQHR